MPKKILLSFAVVLAVLCTWQWDMLMYGLMQGKGQFKVIAGAKPIEEFLEDPDYPDSLKSQLLIIEEIRQFAIDSLGINDTDNYRSMYDQQGKVTLWNLSACEPFALEAHQWSFPLLGSFPYKGFFEIEKARKEEQYLKDMGLDTRIRPVGGWSTLGWFDDPILSNMLNRPIGNLAELIIHELTHGTLYIKDSVAYNENLASFIGEKGAQKFLASKYGRGVVEYQNYVLGRKDFRKFRDHFIRGSKALDSLYNTMATEVGIEAKRKMKSEMIGQIIETMDTISFNRKGRYQNRFENSLPNNTYFMSFLRYHSKQDDFEREFQEKFKSNIKSYLSYLKEKYPSL